MILEAFVCLIYYCKINDGELTEASSSSIVVLRVLHGVQANPTSKEPHRLRPPLPRTMLERVE